MANKEADALEALMTEHGGLASAVSIRLRPVLHVAARWYVAQLLCTLLQPVLIFGLLRWLEDNASSDGGSWATWGGWILVAALSAASLVAAIAMQRCVVCCQHAGARVRAGVTALAYRKCLRICNVGAGGSEIQPASASSVGELTSLFEELGALTEYLNAIVGPRCSRWRSSC